MKPRYTEKTNIAFTPKQAEAIRKLAEQEKVSLADIVRECVDNDLPKLRERLRKRKKSEGRKN